MGFLLHEITANLERNALKHCIEQLAPQLSEPQCKPFLALGITYTTHHAATSSNITFDFYPFLCDTKEQADYAASHYEWGNVFEVGEVRKEFNIQIKE